MDDHLHLSVFKQRLMAPTNISRDRNILSNFIHLVTQLRTFSSVLTKLLLMSIQTKALKPPVLPT